MTTRRWLSSFILSLALVSAALTCAVDDPAWAVGPGCGLPGAGPCVGSQHTTYFDVSQPSSQNGTGSGDNFIRLLNPTQSTVCAMFYVFDVKGEQAECCGCLVSPDSLQSYSVKNNLTNNWAIEGGGLTVPPPAGVIEILSTAPNLPKNILSCSSRPGGCQYGCDATQPAAAAHAINGYILHNQSAPSTGIARAATLPEVPLLDEGDPDSREQNSLVTVCAQRIGNGTAGGRCSCPPAQATPAATPIVKR